MKPSTLPGLSGWVKLRKNNMSRHSDPERSEGEESLHRREILRHFVPQNKTCDFAHVTPPLKVDIRRGNKYFGRF